MPTALGREYIAILSTNERGPIERRPATTRREAFAAARILLDVAERGAWNQGEVVAAPEQFERWYAMAPWRASGTNIKAPVRSRSRSTVYPSGPYCAGAVVNMGRELW